LAAFGNFTRVSPCIILSLFNIGWTTRIKWYARGLGWCFAALKYSVVPLRMQECRSEHFIKFTDQPLTSRTVKVRCAAPGVTESQIGCGGIVLRGGGLPINIGVRDGKSFIVTYEYSMCYNLTTSRSSARNNGDSHSSVCLLDFSKLEILDTYVFIFIKFYIY